MSKMRLAGTTPITFHTEYRMWYRMLLYQKTPNGFLYHRFMFWDVLENRWHSMMAEHVPL